MINIDAEHNDDEEKPELSIKFSNASCFGQMWGGTPNDGEELRDKFQTFNLGEAPTNNILSDEEIISDIPVVTIKNRKANKYNSADIKKYNDSQRILPLQIIDVLVSTIITKKPALYKFVGENYRFVRIVGTVISKKCTKENKATIGVDDGTGVISCIVDNTDSVMKEKFETNNLAEVCATLDVLDKEEVLELSRLDDAEFFERIQDKAVEDRFLNTISRMVLEHTKKLWEEYPVIADINIGDNITIIGDVSDYMEQRLVFVKTLKRDRNLAVYMNHMTESIKHKELLFRDK